VRKKAVRVPVTGGRKKGEEGGGPNKMYSPILQPKNREKREKRGAVLFIVSFKRKTNKRYKTIAQ